MTVEKIPEDKEPKVPTINVISYETVDLEKGCYPGVYVMQYFMMEDGVNRKEDQEDKDPDTD